MKSFQDQVAIITGAGSGIGLSIALDLYKLGAKIIAADLDGEKLGRMLPEDKNVILVQGNIALRKDREKILKAAIAEGGPDLLVNAAGIIRVENIFEVTEENWDLVMDVNAKACFFICQSVGNYWVENDKKGVIVNFSSAAGKTARTLDLASYNASKASVIAITKSMAYSLAPYGCRVNCVCPGIIETPMQQALIQGISNNHISPEETAKERLKMVPLGREGTAEEVSQVVLFLLSESSTYMTGQAINITGGMVMY